MDAGLFDLIVQNLLTPAILFFALGIFAGHFKSDLEIPSSISRYLSIYLMMSIGFKGGVAIAQTGIFQAEILMTIFAGMALGFLQPFIGYFLLQKTTKLDSATAAAVAAHYGSISMVTFVTAVSFLDINSVIYAGYIVAVLALMEAPAIFSGLFIAHRAMPETDISSGKLAGHILSNAAIVLLFGSFVIGWATGDSGMEKMQAFLIDPFQGILALFLLDMGLMVSKNLENFKDFSPSLIGFGIYMPLIGAVLGLGAAALIGLDVGTGFLFMVLTASASYIAVPAAMRLALPQAKASIYVPLSLAITFPFNIVLGLPLYYALADYILKG